MAMRPAMAKAPSTRRSCANRPIIGPPVVRSDGDAFAIGRHPAPRARPVAALDHTLLVDLGDDLAIAGEQRFGRAHLGAQWQLALKQAVGAVFLIFLAA